MQQPQLTVARFSSWCPHLPLPPRGRLWLRTGCLVPAVPPCLPLLVQPPVSKDNSERQWCERCRRRCVRQVHGVGAEGGTALHAFSDQALPPPLQFQSFLCCLQWGYKCHQQNSGGGSQAHFSLKPSSRDFFFRICRAPELSSYHKKGNKSFCLPCASVLPRPVAVSGNALPVVEKFERWLNCCLARQRCEGTC